MHSCFGFAVYSTSERGVSVGGREREVEDEATFGASARCQRGVHLVAQGFCDCQIQGWTSVASAHLLDRGLEGFEEVHELLGRYLDTRMVNLRRDDRSRRFIDPTRFDEDQGCPRAVCLDAVGEETYDVDQDLGVGVGGRRQ